MKHNAQSSRLTGDPPGFSADLLSIQEAGTGTCVLRRLRQIAAATPCGDALWQAKESKGQRGTQYCATPSAAAAVPATSQVAPCTYNGITSPSQVIQSNAVTFRCVSRLVYLSLFSLLQPRRHPLPSSRHPLAFLFFPSLFLFPFLLSPALFLILPFSLSFSCRTSSCRFETFALSSLSSDHP